jgi:hypothetical protein
MGYMKNSISIMLCDKVSGECASVDKVDTSSVQALKGWVSRLIQWCPEAEFEVLEGSKQVKRYFRQYFRKIRKFKFEQQALLYAEKWGVIDYKVKGFRMTWKEFHYGEGTYKVVLDLKTMQEERKLMKRS